MSLLWYVINYPDEWLKSGKEGVQKIQNAHYEVHEAFSRSQWSIACLELNKKGHLHTQGAVFYKKKPQKAKTVNRVLRCGRDNEILPFERLQMDWCNGTCEDSKNYIAHLGPHKDKGPLWDLFESGNCKDADVLLAQARIAQRGTRTDILELKKDMAAEGLRKAVLKNDSNFVTFAKFPNGIRQSHEFMMSEQREKEGFRKPNFYILWGPPDSDKTRRAFEYMQELRRYIVPAWLPGQVPWMGKYDNQPIIIINDFSGQVDFDHFMNFTDGYPVDLPNKGGYVVNSFHTIIITSNIHPQHWFQVSSVKIGGFMRRIKNIHQCFPQAHMPMQWSQVPQSTDAQKLNPFN